jgi:hypothetical protein
MPATIPTRDQALFPPALADMLLAAAQGILHGVLTIGFTFNQADASVLFTVPAGYRMKIIDACWEPTTSFTGGASSAIGLSSSNAGYNTKGDILGGAAGDVAAGLTAVPATPMKRTIGAKIAAGVFLVAGDTIRFDRIVSAFTAGVGNVHIEYQLIPTS